ncbi:Glutamate 5-kinase [Lactobacillus equicursoris DSM 19284 = JCM 14600 = CIP 110162]|uniref:Glutamate 5-kinase n=3 Tax=Lactobacillus equicursoris TaxID=420645 RepID=K0NX06_9LACO|nr:glutamate 5-kinase [Lactobacillus equicursoris]KRL03330.1 glutamate 5-kinase [Lactobacillus equicursoris DSM 19284 = JCM 14600 = CIP 110162]MDD6387038.1 glutamate 5-kinase [Lactobacillus equicursoris]MDD6406608.1 glutamate 5-kinase [Lactobacillus equicursoris]MST80177.1 glutamate 5-kinase [Lactobacillus equicursoris]CCK84472.1 Glutamate 5-kinase [Lactobacillus equicursoris 66c]
MEENLIVFKVGTSSLTSPAGDLDPSKILKITSQLAALHQKGYKLVLVTSGSIAAGFRRLGFDKRPKKVADKQAAAAVGQGLLIEEYTKDLLAKGVVSAQILLTQDDFADQRRYQNASNALSVLINRRVIPIINENDTIAIDELKVGDNDTLSAQVASLLKADLLVLLTDVPGLYSANPRTNPNAHPIPVIENITPKTFEIAGGAGSSNGTGGMATKIKAADMATKSGVPVFICSSESSQAMIDAVDQLNQGTLFTANENAFNQKKQWLAFYAPTTAKVFIDQGAVNAMAKKGSSLLISGIKQVKGDFQKDDIVEVYSLTSKHLIGKGKARFSKPVLKEILEQNHPEGIFIHRDDWVTTL